MATALRFCRGGRVGKGRLSGLDERSDGREDGGFVERSVERATAFIRRIAAAWRAST